MTTPKMETVPVMVTNFPEDKRPVTISTSGKTYIIDPANVAGPSQVQICDYEPNRRRVLIYCNDSQVSLCLDPPTLSPDSSDASHAPASGGARLPVGANGGVELFGKDAMWINSLGTVTRVTVIKEYER